MIYPLEPGIVATFASGLEEIFVVEEKRAFIELFLRDLLYHQADRPRIVGKVDEFGDSLVPAHGEHDADKIAILLAKRLSRRIPSEAIEARLRELEMANRAASLSLIQPVCSANTLFLLRLSPQSLPTDA
jgi:indolepyruvate ferredoxin oxidoreductase